MFLSGSHDLLDPPKVWFGVEFRGSITDPRMAGIGAERKLIFEVSCFRSCPLRDVAGELSDSPSWEMGWTPLTVQKDGRTRYYSGDIARIVDAVPDLAVGRP